MPFGASTIHDVATLIVAGALLAVGWLAVHGVWTAPTTPIPLWKVIAIVVVIVLLLLLLAGVV